MQWRRCSRNGDVFFAAAGGAFADFTEIVVLLTAAHAVLEQIEDQVVDSERGGDMISRVGKFGGHFGCETRDVPGPVLAGAKEKGADDDSGCAAFYAIGVSGGDGGLGQFHMGGFDDLVF